jgi:hypothetical protein
MFISRLSVGVATLSLYLLSGCGAEPPTPEISKKRNALSSPKCLSATLKTTKAGKPLDDCKPPTKKAAVDEKVKAWRSAWIRKKTALEKGDTAALDGEGRSLFESLKSLSPEERKLRMADAKDAHYRKAVSK